MAGPLQGLNISLACLALLWVQCCGYNYTGMEKYGCPKNCKCSLLKGEWDAWYPTCYVDRITSHSDYTPLSGSRTRYLNIICSNARTPGRIPDGLFKHFTNLRKLGLVACHLTAIGPQTFSGVSGLERLLIGVAGKANGNPGLIIDKTAFHHEGLQNLTRIDISVCSIRYIPSYTFCALTELRTLNVSHNFISRQEGLGLAPDCQFIFDSWACAKCVMPLLTTLDASNNYLPQLKYRFVEISSQFKNIDLSNNVILHLSADIFRNLTSLELLDLSANKLTTLSPDQFKGLESLIKLSLAFNLIHHIPHDLFRDLSQLRSLDLKYNNIGNQVLDVSVLGHLIKLNTLDLGQNRISDLNGCVTFENMTELVNLYLYANTITTIPISCFKSQVKLSVLYLTLNNLTHLTNISLSGLHLLQRLNIARNSLQTIDNQAFCKFNITLQVLNISHNLLDCIPESLACLTGLTILDLQHNYIKVIDPDVFIGLAKLLILWMNSNSIVEVPEMAFKNMSRLQGLDLRDNKIKYLQPFSFRNMTDLLYLNMNNNQIKYVGISFDVLPKLYYLFLRNNSIEALGNTVTYFPASLIYIDLSYNRIKTIGYKPFVGLPHLRGIDMTSNDLRRFTKEDLSVSRYLPRPYIMLARNTLLCDCTMPWMLSINKDTVGPYLTIPDLENITCSNENKYLVELKFEDFVCTLPQICTSEDYKQCPCCNGDAFLGIKYTHCPKKCLEPCPMGCKCFKNHASSIHAVLAVVCDNQNMSQIPDNLPRSVLQFSFADNNIQSLHTGVFENCSNAVDLNLSYNAISVIAPDAFEGLKQLTVLNLHGNQLRSLQQWMFQHIEATLLDLYLHDNEIQSIDNDTFSQLRQLKTLYLHNNNLMSVTLSLVTDPPVHSLSLAGNPWSCDCQHGPGTLKFLSAFAQVIVDISNVTCDPNREWSDSIYANITSNNSMSQVAQYKEAFVVPDSYPGTVSKYDTHSTTEYPEESKAHFSMLQTDFGFCFPNNLSTSPHEQPHLVALSVISTLFLFSVTVALSIYSLRELIKLWLFKHFGLRFYRPLEEANKTYDAFISYSHKDELLVVRTLAPGLEAMNPPYKLCLHYRDWPVGASIADTIIQSVNDSRRTILLVSDHFVKSEWCQYEFQAAHHQVLKDKKTRLIVILLNDICHRRLEPQLRLYIKTNTYLKWNDPRFWERLRFVMPDKTVQAEDQAGLVMEMEMPAMANPAGGEPPQAEARM